MGGRNRDAPESCETAADVAEATEAKHGPWVEGRFKLLGYYVDEESGKAFPLLADPGSKLTPDEAAGILACSRRLPFGDASCLAFATLHFRRANRRGPARGAPPMPGPGRLDGSGRRRTP